MILVSLREAIIINYMVNNGNSFQVLSETLPVGKWLTIYYYYIPVNLDPNLQFIGEVSQLLSKGPTPWLFNIIGGNTFWKNYFYSFYSKSNI